MSQDVPHIIGFPDDERGSNEPNEPLGGETIDLSLLVLKHVGLAPMAVWMSLWRRAGFRQCVLPRVTLADAAAVTDMSKTAAQQHLVKLQQCGLVTVLRTDLGCSGGMMLRVEDAPAIFASVFKPVRGDPQRPMPDDRSGQIECQPSPSSTLHSPPPIIDHGLRALPNHRHGQVHRAAPASAALTNDDDGNQVNVKSDVDVETRRLNAMVQRRRREMRQHLEQRPDDARQLREVLGQALPGGTDRVPAQREDAQHKLICDTIERGVSDPQMPVGLIHDVADLVVAGNLPHRALTRILKQMGRRDITNRGGYFRRCVEGECRKRQVDPPKAIRGP